MANSRRSPGTPLSPRPFLMRPASEKSSWKFKLLQTCGAPTREPARCVVALHAAAQRLPPVLVRDVLHEQSRRGRLPEYFEAVAPADVQHRACRHFDRVRAIRGLRADVLDGGVDREVAASEAIVGA